MTATKSDNMKSLRRAIERQAKDATDWKWEAETECGVFHGQFNTTTIQAHASGFEVTVSHGTPQPILSGDYKTLGAALRSGRMYSNSNYGRT
jgi:hypothetical protein